MKELQAHDRLPNVNKVELNVKKKQEIEHVLEGNITPKKGHFVWELNEESGEVKKASYKADTVAFNANAEVRSEKLVKNPTCIYIPALNKKNAIAKYLKNKEQSFYFNREAPGKLDDLNFKM